MYLNNKGKRKEKVIVIDKPLFFKQDYFILIVDDVLVKGLMYGRVMSSSNVYYIIVGYVQSFLYK